jgi:hypothetical protein
LTIPSTRITGARAKVAELVEALAKPLTSLVDHRDHDQDEDENGQEARGIQEVHGVLRLLTDPPRATTPSTVEARTLNSHQKRPIETMLGATSGTSANDSTFSRDAPVTAARPMI